MARKSQLGKIMLAYAALLRKSSVCSHRLVFRHQYSTDCIDSVAKSYYFHREKFQGSITSLNQNTYRSRRLPDFHLPNTGLDEQQLHRRPFMASYHKFGAPTASQLLMRNLKNFVLKKEHKSSGAKHLLFWSLTKLGQSSAAPPLPGNQHSKKVGYIVRIGYEYEENRTKQYFDSNSWAFEN